MTLMNLINKIIRVNNHNVFIILSALEGVQSGVPTRTTSTLTPTTLKNIEHFFEAAPVLPPETHFNQAGFVPPPVHLPAATKGNTFVSVDSKSWAGGAVTFSNAPVVTSVRQPAGIPASILSTDSAMLSASPSPPLDTVPKQRRLGGRRPLIDDNLSMEEEERRQMRRRRNKEAAARCRKRRLDQTNRLQDETDGLEDHREALQQEINSLTQQRDEFEVLLAAHKPTCKMNRVIHGKGPKLSAAAPPSTSPLPHSPSIIVVKEEPFDDALLGGPKPARPTTLALGGCATDLGIVIETPSAGLRGLGLNFDSMMEGGTGLTPVGSSSVMLMGTGLTPLTTPVVTSAPSPSPSCATQLHRSGVQTVEMASPDSGLPPKLVSL